MEETKKNFTSQCRLYTEKKKKNFVPKNISFSSRTKGRAANDTICTALYGRRVSLLRCRGPTVRMGKDSRAFWVIKRRAATRSTIYSPTVEFSLRPCARLWPLEPRRFRIRSNTALRLEKFEPPFLVVRICTWREEVCLQCAYARASLKQIFVNFEPLWCS